MSLPTWIKKEWKKRTPKENVEHPDWRLFQALAVAWEALGEVSGYDCHNYDKHLNPKPCLKCSSCIPREAMRRIEELGD